MGRKGGNGGGWGGIVLRGSDEGGELLESEG